MNEFNYFFLNYITDRELFLEFLKLHFFCLGDSFSELSE